MTLAVWIVSDAIAATAGPLGAAVVVAADANAAGPDGFAGDAAVARPPKGCPMWSWPLIRPFYFGFEQ